MKQQKHKILEYEIDISQIHNPQLRRTLSDRLESGYMFIGRYPIPKGWHEEADYHHSKEEDDKWTDYYVHIDKGPGGTFGHGIDKEDYNESS